MGDPQRSPDPAPAAADDPLRQEFFALEREAKARGAEPSAARLFHELGRQWEERAKNPRSAAVAYQQAYQIAPAFRPNLQSARQLFTEVGNWQMVVQLLDAEIAAAEPSEAPALLFEKATLLEDHLSRESEALAALRACLAARPTDLALLLNLEGRFAASADYEGLVDVNLLFAEALKDSALRAHHLTCAALLCEHRLSRPAQAATLLRSAFALERKNPLLLAAMRRLAEREGQHDELLGVLAAEAERLGPLAGPTYLHIAKVYEKLDRRADALASLTAARRVNPQDPLVLSELARAFEVQGRHEDLADVLRALAEQVTDETEVVALNLKLAALYEEDLRRDEEAIVCFQSILARIPGHLGALSGLGKLYHKLGRWQELVTINDAELEALAESKQRAARLYRAAEILEQHLGRTDEAVERYRRCLKLQADFLPAHKALVRLYEKAGRFAELLDLYERDLVHTLDRDQTVAVLSKMAVVAEERLGDVGTAIDCLRRALDAASDHLPTIRSLARLYERSGNWRELIHLNETEAGLAGDTQRVLALHHQNAEILDLALNDRPGAINAYERLLALSPSYLPALQALGRLFAQEARWDDLVRMYQAEAEISPSPEHSANLIYKIGELHEHRRADAPAAIASYREVLALAPQHFNALRALARIYRAQGAWEALIEVLRAEAQNRTDPLERANAIYQVATIWEDQLGRNDMAQRCYEESLRLAPGHPSALRALERLCTIERNAKGLVAVLELETQTAPTVGAKVDAYVRLAEIYLDQFVEPSRAAQCCEAALEIDSQNLIALKLLERVRAGDRSRRSELRDRLAAGVGDPGLKAGLKLVASLDRDRPPEAGLGALQEAFVANVSDARVGASLEKALRRTGDQDGLLAYLQKRIERAGSPEERASLLMRRGELAEAALQQRPLATESYRAVLQLDPSFIPAYAALRRVALATDQFDEAISAFEGEGEASRDPANAAAAFVSAGKLAAGRLNDRERALSCFKRALERDPLHAEAGQEAEVLLSELAASEELAHFLQRRGEARLGQKDTSGAKADLLRAARVWASLPEHAPRALIVVEQLLELDPDHTGALEVKGNLTAAAGQYADAAAAYAHRVQQGGEPRELLPFHLKLASLYQDHLQDFTRAAAHLMTALTTDPVHVEALERLATIHTASRNWTGASDCLKRLLEVDAVPHARARWTVALAGIVEEGFRDLPQAAELYRKALELDPVEGAAVDRLLGLYDRLQKLPELVELLENQASHAQGADPQRACALLLRVAAIEAGPLSRPPRAIDALRKVLQIDPASLPAHVELARILSEDPASTDDAVVQHRRILQLDPGKLESVHSLFRTWQAAGLADRAFCAAGALEFLNAANSDEAAFYEQTKNRLPSQPLPRLLSLSEIDLLSHPGVRGDPLVALFGVMGDQLAKILPPAFDSLGVDRRADRLRAEHPLTVMIRKAADVFGVEAFELFQSKRGLFVVETGDPPALCVGQDVAKRFAAREQFFLMGRALFGLLHKTAVLNKLSSGEVADLLGNTVRIAQPMFDLLGRPNDDQIRQLRRAFPRKILKALEAPSQRLMTVKALDLDFTLEALAYSADRAGLLLCGDVNVGLSMVLREGNYSGVKPDDSAAIVHAVRQREDLRELVAFSLSDDFFRLRQKIGISV